MKAAIALSQGVCSRLFGRRKMRYTEASNSSRKAPLRQPQTLRNGILWSWETLQTDVTVCRAIVRNRSYHNHFDFQLYLICIDYCISPVNWFSWPGHWGAIPEQFLPSVGVPEARGENLQSQGLLSVFVYGRCCFRPSLSLPSPILPGLEPSCESVTKDWIIGRFSSGLGSFINYLRIFLIFKKILYREFIGLNFRMNQFQPHKGTKETPEFYWLRGQEEDTVAKSKTVFLWFCKMFVYLPAAFLPSLVTVSCGGLLFCFSSSSFISLLGNWGAFPSAPEKPWEMTDKLAPLEVDIRTWAWILFSQFSLVVQLGLFFKLMVGEKVDVSWLKICGQISLAYNFRVYTFSSWQGTICF